MPAYFCCKCFDTERSSHIKDVRFACTVRLKNHGERQALRIKGSARVPPENAKENRMHFVIVAQH